ncbi:hypothetical protein D9Q98_003900 [Chlorella vulgaris]|uniref:Uncharacterized protein n=1 Tax=Chlorella vulgaris TaxID=3077 RepID=A0A9D4TQP0_CHLVU|nr:hypothetical protein D9Q98_003900 [Chlorella vulgaris]
MGKQRKRHTKRSNPPGNPTGKSQSRFSPQKKAERAIWRQFGAKPFDNPDKFGWKGLFEHSCRRSPFNEHDIAFVEQCPESSLERTALYLQQRSVFKPSAGESAAALEARYEPIDEVYTLQTAAVERRGIIVIIGSKCYVAAAAAVKRSQDERGRQQQQQEQQQQQQQQDAPPPLERVVAAPEPWRQFDPLNCLVHRMMAACAGSCGPAAPQAAAANGSGGSGSNGSEGSAAPERTFTLSQLEEAGTSKLERSLWEGQELPDGVVIRNDKQRGSVKAMLDWLARLEAAGFTPLIDLFECSSFGIHLVLPADHQTAGLTADMLDHMLRLRSGNPEASATGLAKMLEMFGRHHQSQGAEYLAAVLQGGIPPEFESLLQAGHAAEAREAALSVPVPPPPWPATNGGGLHRKMPTFMQQLQILPTDARRAKARPNSILSSIGNLWARQWGVLQRLHGPGASYALGFSQTVIRSQLVAVRSPSSGRCYLANVLELHCASLLGTGRGLDARGELQVAEADLQPFEVAWDDAAALRGHVLSRLLDVNMQCKLNSIVSHICTAAYRLGPALLAIAGVDCFDPSINWAHRCFAGGVLNVDKWRKAVSSRSQEAADMQLILDSRMLSIQQMQRLGVGQSAL